MAQPDGFRRAGRARCDEHNRQLVDMSGRIFRPRHCFTIIQTMGTDAWNGMIGFVGNRDGRLNKANQRAQFVFGQCRIQQNRDGAARPDGKQVCDETGAATMNNRHGISGPDAEITKYSNPSIDLLDKAVAIPRDRQRQVMNRATEVKRPAHSNEIVGIRGCKRLNRMRSRHDLLPMSVYRCFRNLRVKTLIEALATTL